MSDSFKSGCNNTSKCESVQYFREKNLFDFKGGFAFLKDCIDAERICLRKLISICGDHIRFEADSKILIHCVN